MEQNKKKLEFNIIKNDPTDGHKGYGIGSLSLENITPVMIDVDEGEVWIESQAMHPRSKTERRVKYLKTQEELKEDYPIEDLKRCWIIWVAVDRKGEGQYYAWLGSCELYINRPARRGFKSMPQHVNHMDKAMKGKIVVDSMDDKSRLALADFLKKHDEGMWERSSDELKQALS